MRSHQKAALFTLIAGIIATILAVITDELFGYPWLLMRLFIAALLCHAGYRLAKIVYSMVFHFSIDKEIPRKLQLRGLSIFALILASLIFIGLGKTGGSILIASIVMSIISYKFTPDMTFDLEQRHQTRLTRDLQKVTTTHPDIHLSDFGTRDAFGIGNSKTFSKNTIIPVGDADYYIRDISYGSSQWIPDRQKEALTDRDTKSEEPLYRGLWLGGGFFHHKEGNLVTIAPPGKGKGAALIIPNLLWRRKYKHSFVVFDPKGTNACITARFQQQVGQKVIIIDPLGLQTLNRAKHNIPSSSFNPLDFIANDIFNGAGQIVNLLLPDGSADDRFWINRAKDLLIGVIMHVMTYPKYESERNLVTVYKLVRGGNLVELFEDMMQNKNEAYGGEIRRCGDDFDAMNTSSTTTLYSILSFVSNALSWIGNPEIQKCITYSDFHPHEIADGGISLYLCQPIHSRELFATFSRLVIGAIMRENSKASATPKAWVYYLLDEFPSMGVFPEVITSLALAREYKMRIWIFAQTMSQLDSVYGESTKETIIGTANVLQAFGIKDRRTAEYISAKLGTTTVISDKISQTSTVEKDMRSIERTKSLQVSKSSDKVSRRLLNEEELEREPNIITITEWGPMRLSRWQYWENPIDKISKEYSQVFKDGRADPNPNF